MFYLNGVGYKGSIWKDPKNGTVQFYLNGVGYKVSKGLSEKGAYIVFYLNGVGYKERIYSCTSSKDLCFI